jgi:hypothetical protein
MDNNLDDKKIHEGCCNTLIGANESLPALRLAIGLAFGEFTITSNNLACSDGMNSDGMNDLIGRTFFGCVMDYEVTRTESIWERIERVVVIYEVQNLYQWQKLRDFAFSFDR